MISPKASGARSVSSPGKTRITIYIDNATLDEFRARAEAAGTGYQTMMNDALAELSKQGTEKPVTESVLRRVLQEERLAAEQTIPA